LNTLQKKYVSLISLSRRRLMMKANNTMRENAFSFSSKVKVALLLFRGMKVFSSLCALFKHAAQFQNKQP
jgi:hypothetical protein